MNWDPVDGTVLANEQVIDGRGWRSGAPVEKKRLAQWFFRITKYAPELLAALDTLDRWPERVRLMQANWIGRSEGARLRFALTEAVAGADGPIDGVEVYTTRPDTLFGMSFLAMAPEHPLAAAVAARDAGAAAFIAECQRLGTSEAVIEATEKRGYDTGLRVGHPFIAGGEVPGVDRQFRADGVRHGGDLRLSRRTTSAIWSSRAKYGLPVPPVVLPAGEDPARFAVGGYGVCGAGGDVQLRVPGWAGSAWAGERGGDCGAGAAGRSARAW